MHTEPDIPINIFIVDPENQKLVSGAVSFTQRSRQKLRGLIFAFGLIPLIGVGILFVFNRIRSSAGCAPYLLIVAFAVLVIREASSTLNAVRIYRRLGSGQFLDGYIVSSTLDAQNRGGSWDFRRKIYMQNTGQGEGLRLRVTYRFQTPDGKSRTGSAEDRKRLHELAPEPGTPLKIRYVDEGFFRVM